MDRKLLKQQSKNLIRNAQPKPVVAAIIYILITAVLAFLSYKLVGGYDSSLSNQLQEFAIEFENGNYIDPDQFVYALQGATPSPAASLLDLAIDIVTAMLGAGFAIFCLRTIRGFEASYWNIFDSFAMFFRIIWLYIVEIFFISLWSLLLIFPGIIAYYRYRMAIYLVLEHPEMSVMQCIRESKRLMTGHKGELFVLDLSFIGWALLVALASYAGDEIAAMLPYSALTEMLTVVGLGIFVQFYVYPYIQLTAAGYYKQLTEQDAARNAFNNGWTPEF